MARVGITEAARRLGVSVDSIRRRIRKGDLPAQRDNKGQWWLDLADDALPEPEEPSVQDRLVPLMLAPAYAPTQVPAYAPVQMPMQISEAATALADALRGQVADLAARLDRADARLAATEADHRSERAVWAAERARLLVLIETLATRAVVEPVAAPEEAAAAPQEPAVADEPAPVEEAAAVREPVTMETARGPGLRRLLMRLLRRSTAG